MNTNPLRLPFTMISHFCLFGLMVFLGVVFLFGCASPSRSSVEYAVPEQVILADDCVELPAEVIDGALCIEARINGAGPFHLSVDTGASELCLFADAAKKAGLRLQAGAVNVQGLNGPVESQTHETKIELFESGGLSLKGVPAFVTSESDTASIHLATPSLDGFLGLRPLANVILQIDFPKRQVYVFRPGKQTYPAESGYSYIPSKTGIPMAKVTVGGKTFSASLDTGADSALVLPRLDGVPLHYPPIEQQIYSMSVGADPEPIEGSQIDGDVRFGPVTLHDPPVRIGEARIGRAVLGRWKIVLDQQKRRVYFIGPELTARWAAEKPGATDSTPQVTVGKLFDTLYNIEGTGVRLLGVEAGGIGALAGLRDGDLVAFINGETAASFVRRVKKDNLTLMAPPKVLRIDGPPPQVLVLIGVGEPTK